MADIKTILRELSVIVGIGAARENKTINNLNPAEFIALAEKYCKNIMENRSELNKIKSLKTFGGSEINSIMQIVYNPSSMRKCNTWRNSLIAGTLGGYGKRIQTHQSRGEG